MEPPVCTYPPLFIVTHIQFLLCIFYFCSLVYRNYLLIFFFFICFYIFFFFFFQFAMDNSPLETLLFFPFLFSHLRRTDVFNFFFPIFCSICNGLLSTRNSSFFFNLFSPICGGLILARIFFHFFFVCG